MNIPGGLLKVAGVAAMLWIAVAAASHGSSEHKGGAHSGSEETMKAQHERMANFKEAADMISNGIIHGAGKMVLEGAEKIDLSLQGHERDIPHKNRSRAKEFHGLFVELGKRTERLQAAIRANDFPKSAVAFGRVLETCATCHGIFRD